MVTSSGWDSHKLACLEQDLLVLQREFNEAQEAAVQEKLLVRIANLEAMLPVFRQMERFMASTRRSGR